MRISKRRVFYISGFDPRGVGAYHRLFAEEAARHAARAGVELAVGERRRASRFASTWRAEHRNDAGPFETTFEFLHWDDIARRHWHTGLAALYRLALKTYWHWVFASDFLFGRIFRVSRWNFLTGVSPGLVLFFLPVLALLSAWAGYGLAQALAPHARWLATAAAAALFAAVVVAGWWLQKWFSLGWLLRTYGFVIDCSLGRVSELDERARRFGERVLEHARSAPDEEILVVGHSVGANVAVAALARALETDPEAFHGHRVGLLTLGGSIPMQAIMPWSGPFRDDLARVAGAEGLCWVDMTAKQDVASFAMLDPLEISGVALDRPAPARPRVVSGQFREMLDPATYDAQTWDVFRMHFLYLMAGDRAVPNHYFDITLQAVPLRERFKQET